MLIESSLNELHKIIHDKDSKIIQLQKDKDYLKDSITNSKYEFESVNDENEKLKKQIKILFEKQNDLKETIQEKELEIRSLENTKRQAEKLLQTKNNSLLHSVEEKLFDSNEQVKQKENQIKELVSRNEYLQNIIELSKSEEEVLHYDNTNQKKQIKMLRETIEDLEKQIKRFEYNQMMNSTSSSKKRNIPSNIPKKKLDNLEKKLNDTKQDPIENDSELNPKVPVKRLTEEEILKNNLGL